MQYEASTAFVVSVVRVQMSYRFTEGLIIGALESFQGSKPLITEVGCLLPTLYCKKWLVSNFYGMILLLGNWMVLHQNVAISIP